MPEINQYKLVYIAEAKKISNSHLIDFGHMPVESTLAEKHLAEEEWERNNLHLGSIGISRRNQPKNNGYEIVRFFPNKIASIPNESLKDLNLLSLFPYLILVLNSSKIASRIRSGR